MARGDNRGPELLAVDVAFLSTAVTANALRCYVRVRMVRAFGWDDWLMAVATASFILYCSFSIAGVHYGSGRHHEDLSLRDVQLATHYWWYCYLFYCITMITSKLSIGWFLLRIAIKRLHTIIIWVAMTMSLVAGVVFFFITLFQCQPISYFWHKVGQEGQCISIEIVIGLAYLYSTFSVISDFTFALLPAFLVMGLQLNKRTKTALIPLLTMGCIASAAVVARVPYMKNFRDPDFLWATLDIAIWSTVEQGLAITAGSLATLRPLFTSFLRRAGLSSSPSKPNPASGTNPMFPTTRRKGSADMLDRYRLNTFTETTCAKGDDIFTEQELSSGTWNPPKSYTGQLARKKSVKGEVKRDNESETSLKRVGTSDGESEEGDGMRVMVTKTFMVTEPASERERAGW
ncbi:hypothetical protein M011DRAFT_516460 [Sporormia fimetaria CBS 119925]|uniref:Rhodopsin domain-containing protein n=1 Tax=Sporormia fimetaria CBS 119925 TaxID=1340428 RepID=A0A6A6VNI7_9PLEO|nr:hypothetical protein M011DRAFT_516460 [Sporormia fimetaria CBS 119925]